MNICVGTNQKENEIIRSGIKEVEVEMWFSRDTCLWTFVLVKLYEETETEMYLINFPKNQQSISCFMGPDFTTFSNQILRKNNNVTY